MATPPTITGTITANAATPPPAPPAGYDPRDQQPLSEPRRAQLDSIVQQMMANKEPDANIQTVVADFKTKYAAPVDNSMLGKVSRGAAAFDARMAHNHDPRTIVHGLMSSPESEGLNKFVPSALSADIAERSQLHDQAAEDFRGGHYAAGVVHGLDSIVPLLGPMINRAGKAAASGSPEAIGEAAADITSLKTVPEVYGAAGRGVVAAAEAAPVVAEAAGKYGARIAENAPAVGTALVKGGKTAVAGVVRGTAAHFVPGIGTPLTVLEVANTARRLVADGTVKDFGTAVKNLLSKPSTAEVMDASGKRGQAAPWRAFPDIHAEVADEFAPATDAELPSGRTAGGVENQAPEQAPSPLGPRRAPGWANLPTPEPEAPAAAAPAAEAALPSGRKPGSIENQAAVPKTEPVAAPQSEAGAPATAAAPAGRALTPSEKILMQSVDNKVAVLSHYVQANGFSAADLAPYAEAAGRIRQFADEAKLPETARRSQIRKAAQAAGRDDIVGAIDKEQEFADAAYVHGVTNNLPVPQKGYHGISAGTWQLARDGVPEPSGLAPTGADVAASGDAGRSVSDPRSPLPGERGGIPDAGRSVESEHGNAVPAAGSPRSGLKPKSGAQIEAERRFAKAKEARSKKPAR